ncbi:hypothetical protein MMPV_009613 [Pyropia vietnamensis]
MSEPDYDIPEHRVGDALLDKVTSWKSYRLRDKDPTYTARMARRMARLSQNMSHSFGGFPRFTGKKPFLVFAFLRRFVKAANDNDVSEGRALYLLGNFLAGEAEIRFSKVMPDSAGHIPGRTVSSYPEAVHWLLTNYAEPQALNQAVAECTRATMAASETPEGFAQRLRELGEACGNVHEEDRVKMTFIQGLPDHIRMDCEIYILDNPSFTLQQVVTYASGKFRQYQALNKTSPARPRYYPTRPGPVTMMTRTKEPAGVSVLAVGEQVELPPSRDWKPWPGRTERDSRGVARSPPRAPTRVRACWLCHESTHIATQCDLVPKELQDRLQAQGLVFAKAARWADRSGPRVRKDPVVTHNVRVAILQAVTEALYQDEASGGETDEDPKPAKVAVGNE